MHRATALRFLTLAIVSAIQVVAQNPRVDLVVQTGHSSSVRSVAFSPDGKVLASLGLDNAIKIWDASSGKQLRSIGNSEASASIALSPDGKTIATVSFRDARRNVVRGRDRMPRPVPLLKLATLASADRH